MSMEAKLLTAINAAFKALGDLVKAGTLTSTTTTTYNWSTGQMATTTSSLSVDCVITEENKEKDTANKPVFEIIVKNYDQDLSLYDRISIESRNYKIEQLTQYLNVAVLRARLE